MILRALAGTLLLLTTACATVKQDIVMTASPEVVVSQQRYQTAYIVNSGDVLEVTVERLADLNRTVTVRPDGFVSLPTLGDIEVAGLSVTQAAEKIEAAYGQRLLDPRVDVIVQNPPVPNVYVTGEVGASVAIPLRQVPTAAEAIVVAGGAQRSAKLSDIALIRLHDDGYLRATLIPNAARGRAGMLLALRGVPLQAGDILVVQESNRSQFVRFLQDFVTTPLSSANAIISPYVQLELLQEINN